MCLSLVRLRTKGRGQGECVIHWRLPSYARTIAMQPLSHTHAIKESRRRCVHSSVEVSLNAMCASFSLGVRGTLQGPTSMKSSVRILKSIHNNYFDCMENSSVEICKHEHNCWVELVGIRRTFIGIWRDMRRRAPWTLSSSLVHSEHRPFWAGRHVIVARQTIALTSNGGPNGRLSASMSRTNNAFLFPLLFSSLCVYLYFIHPYMKYDALTFPACSRRNK